jgi:hypothetical protein
MMCVTANGPCCRLLPVSITASLLKPLSVLEQLAIGRVRVDMFIVKLRAVVADAHMFAIKGDAISYAQDGPEAIGRDVQLQYPLLDNVQACNKVVFLGTRDEADRHQRAIRNLPDLRLRPEVIMAWLCVLKDVNPMYVSRCLIRFRWHPFSHLFLLFPHPSSVFP